MPISAGFSYSYETMHCFLFLTHFVEKVKCKRDFLYIKDKNFKSMTVLDGWLAGWLDDCVGKISRETKLRGNLSKSLS